jgi:cytochrome c oxidase subunit 2
MSMKARILILALAVVALPGQVVAEGDAAAGKALYGTCSACHGPQGQGNKALNAPKIAARAEWYLVRQLQNFRKGVRGADAKDMYGKQMAPMAMVLADDAAIANVAAYIASFPDTKPETTVSGDAAKGGALYKTCAACHGARGEANPALNAPGLAGQNDWYLVTQLKNFKAGIRGAGADDTYGRQMAPMAMVLADEQAINDVVAYINSLAE